MNDPIQCFTWDAILISWWRHQMEAFSALLTLCEGNPTVTGRFPSQRPVMLMFSLICDWINGWANNRWFETPLCSLWRHCNMLPDWIVKLQIVRHYPWRHMVSQIRCLFNNLFSLTTKDIEKFHISGRLCGESTGYRLIPLTNRN